MWMHHEIQFTAFLEIVLSILNDRKYKIKATASHDTALSPLLTRLVQWCSRPGSSRVWRRRWPPRWSLARLQYPEVSPQKQQGSSHQVWGPHSEGSSLPEPQCGPNPATEAGRQPVRPVRDVWLSVVWHTFLSSDKTDTSASHCSLDSGDKIKTQVIVIANYGSANGPIIKATPPSLD